MERGERSGGSAGERWPRGPAQRRRGAPGRGPCSPPGASHGKVVSRLPGRRIHRRAGRPLRAPPGPPLRPPSRCLPPSACLRGPAGRGAPCEEDEAEAGPFSTLSLLSAAAAARLVGAPKSLAASPGAGALARSPTGIRRRAGREREGGGRVPAPGRDTVQSLPRSSSLCPLFFYSPRFFSQGEKKPHNLRMCARVEIDVGIKKKGGG